MNINKVLTTVLHVADKHRGVLQFLFGDLLLTPFHRDVSLAPTIFVDALTTDIRVQKQLFSDAPDQYSLPKSLSNDVPSSGTDDALLHTALVLVAVVGAMVVGYAFSGLKMPRDH